MLRRNPFKRHRFPNEIILMAVLGIAGIRCRTAMSAISWPNVGFMLMQRRFIVGFRNLVPKSEIGLTGGIVAGVACNGMLTRHMPG